MLAHILAIAVGLGSFAVYMAAFFFPEVHRKNDFFWSGVGLFYALILWVCAGRITGAVLLGQMASVALLGWFGFQTLYLRRVVTPEFGKTPVPAKLQEKVSSLLTVQGMPPQATATPTINDINQDTTPAIAVQPPAEFVSVEPAPETVETQQQTEPEVSVSAEEIPPEIPEPLAEIPPNPETLLTSETETVGEQQPVTNQPEPEPISATKEIEFEDELDEVISEKTEPSTQPEVTAKAAPQPKRLSRVFRTITGLLNRQKNQAKPTVSPVENPVENPPETLLEPETESSEVEPKTEKTPTLETVVAQEDITPEPVAETETIDITEIDSSPNLETPSSEGEVPEITVTVEPDISSVTPFETMASASEEQEENSPESSEESEESSEEILSEAVEEKPSPVAETTGETEPPVVEENPALKRPNPPDEKLKQASKTPKSSTDSDQ